MNDHGSSWDLAAPLFTIADTHTLWCTTVLAKCTRLARQTWPHLYRASDMPILAYATLCFVLGPRPNLISCRGCLTNFPNSHQKKLSRPPTYETKQATYEIHQQSW